jgi:hypothetical protein
MVAPTDSQLQAVWIAADGLPVQKRGVFLDRVVAWLQLRGSRFTDVDLDNAVRLPLRGDPGFCGLMEPRRFPPPWTVEELDVRFRQSSRTSNYHQP